MAQAAREYVATSATTPLTLFDFDRLGLSSCPTVSGRVMRLPPISLCFLNSRHALRTLNER